MWHLNNLRRALAGGGTPRGHVLVAAAPLLLQLGAVTVLISVGTGVGWEGNGKRGN